MTPEGSGKKGKRNQAPAGLVSNKARGRDCDWNFCMDFYGTR